MSDLVKSILRELVQKGVGIVVLWAAAHGLPVPEAVSSWVVLTLVAGGVALWTIVVRFLETRAEGTALGSFARGLAQLLMLGIKAKPTYPPETPEAVKAVRGY